MYLVTIADHMLIDSPDVNLSTFQPESPSWAFLLQVMLQPDGTFEGDFFHVVACSVSWIANHGWVQPPGGPSWSFTYGDGFLWPWTLLILDDVYAEENVGKALKYIVSGCERKADGDWALFGRLLPRFVFLDDDEFIAPRAGRLRYLPDFEWPKSDPG